MNTWVKIFKEIPEAEQAAALRIKKSTGRPPSIAAKDRATIVALVHEGAEAASFTGDVWTASRVQAAARSKLGVRVGVTTIKKLLHSEGFSVQKPTVKATQQDVAAVVRFRADWAETKKGHSASVQP